MRYSIRTHLLFLVAALAVPLVVVVGYSIYSDAIHTVHDARLSTRTLAETVAANTRRTLDASREAMENLAKRPLMRAVDEKRCDPILRDFRELFPRFANLATVDMNGRAVCSGVDQPGGRPVSIAKTEWFQRFLQQKQFLVGKPFVGPITGRWVSVLVVPLTDERNAVVGAIGLPLDLDNYDPGLSGLPLPKGIRYGLVTQDGILIWRNEDREQLIGKSLAGNAAFQKGLQVLDGEYESVGTDGVRRLYSVIPLPEAGWFAYVGVPTATLYAGAVEHATYGTVFGITLLMVVAILALFLARRIAAPVLSLVAASRALRDGEQGARATASGPRELEQVVREFNLMVDEKLQHEVELDFLAHHDALTRLPNRVLLRDRMRLAMSQMERRGRLLAVCYLDLDGFKPINDVYGHKVGDLLLVEVSKRLADAVRAGDTVARLGGDEFVLLIGDLRTVDELEEILARMQRDISRTYTLEGHTLLLSATIGVALFPLDNNEADTLLRHADQAMYAAKQTGKNRFGFFDPAEELRIRERQATRDRIRQALAECEFLLHYQPKVNMRKGTVVGVEALIRWQHPERGLLPPSEFLPLVEDTEVISAIGDWVLQETLRQQCEWQASGLEIGVSVNVAARQILRPEFLPDLRALLAAHPQVRPECLELEILETAALDDVEMVSRIMAECQSLGIGFALDDFGTGYSSLEYLKRFPAQTLKIDQTFVRDLLEDPEDMAITEGVLGLARAFQRTPIAEGVETVAHGTVLLNLGCDLAQGYAIARPMAPGRLQSWVAEFRPDPAWVEAAAMHWSREDFPLLAMEVEHRRWVATIVAAVSSSERSLLPHDIPDHHGCHFGRWYQGDGWAHYSHLEAFTELGVRHQRVHETAAGIVASLEQGRRYEAEEALTELRARRDDLIDELHRLQRIVASRG